MKPVADSRQRIGPWIFTKLGQLMPVRSVDKFLALDLHLFLGANIVVQIPVRLAPGTIFPSAETLAMRRIENDICGISRIQGKWSEMVQPDFSKADNELMRGCHVPKDSNPKK
jgi:hypothetical protein